MQKNSLETLTSDDNSPFTKRFREVREKLSILNDKMKKSRIERRQKNDVFGRVGCKRRSARLNKKNSILSQDCENSDSTVLNALRPTDSDIFQVKLSESHVSAPPRTRKVVLSSTSEDESDGETEEPKVEKTTEHAERTPQQYNCSSDVENDGLFPFGYLSEMERLKKKEAERKKKKAIRIANERVLEEKRRKEEERELYELRRLRREEQRKSQKKTKKKTQKTEITVKNEVKVKKNGEKRKRRTSKVSALTDPSIDPSVISFYSLNSLPSAPTPPKRRRSQRSRGTQPSNLLLPSHPTPPIHPEDLEDQQENLQTPIDEVQLADVEELYEVINLSELEYLNETGMTTSGMTPYEMEDLDVLFPENTDEPPLYFEDMLDEMNGCMLADTIDDSFLNMINDDKLIVDPVSAFNATFPRCESIP